MTAGAAAARSEAPGAASLAGRGGVVTGGGRGIGASVARALADAGASVVVAARTAAEVEGVAAELTRRGAKAWAVVCDATDAASVARLEEAARRHVTAVDLLVCCAGGGASAPIGKISLEEWNRMLAVNATSAFLCLRAFLPPMVARGWGRIVNVASVAGLEGGRYVAHYSAAKHAVLGLTRSAALEVEGTGVTVNAVCPGFVDTPMTEQTLATVQARTGRSREAALTAVLATIGQKRLIAPQEVAAAVVALCRAEAGGVNGQVVVLRPGGRPA